MTELKIIDEQTIELDGRFYDLRNPEPKVERLNPYADISYNPDRDSHCAELRIYTNTKIAADYIQDRLDLLFRLQRACLKMDGVIERNYEYMYSTNVNAAGNGITWAYYGCGYFNFRTTVDCVLFISSNESDLIEFFNVK